MQKPSVQDVAAGRHASLVLVMQGGADNVHAPQPDLVILKLDAHVARGIEGVRAQAGEKWARGVDEILFRVEDAQVAWMKIGVEGPGSVSEPLKARSGAAFSVSASELDIPHVGKVRRFATDLITSFGEDSTLRPIKWFSTETVEDAFAQGTAIAGAVFAEGALATIREAMSVDDRDDPAILRSRVVGLLAAAAVTQGEDESHSPARERLEKALAEAPTVQLRWVPEYEDGTRRIHALAGAHIAFEAALHEVLECAYGDAEKAEQLLVEARAEIPQDNREESDVLVALDPEVALASERHGGPFRVEISNRDELDEWLETHMPLGASVTRDRGPAV